MSTWRLTLTMLVAVIAIMPLPDVAQPASEAKAKQHKRRYCTKHSRPRGCVAVPASAVRDPTIKPQDDVPMAPGDSVAVSGIGGGPAAREQGAVDWARALEGDKDWAWRNERFIEEAYAMDEPQYASPHAALKHLHLTKGSPKNAPVGSLMFFGSDGFNDDYGHVGLSLGGGVMISALDLVRRTNISVKQYWKNLYLGWAHAPSSWTGRLPVPFNLIGEIPGDHPTITAPATQIPLTGITRLEALAQPAASIGFAAYYSLDPAGGAEPTWRMLGQATAVGTTYTYSWDTRDVIDQGSKATGTVMIAALYLGSDGMPIGVGDYRRTSVRNAP